MTAQAADALAKLDAITFLATTSAGASYDHDGEASATQSHVYDFDESVTFDGITEVVAADRAGNEQTATFRVTRDADAPGVSVATQVQGSDVVVSWSGSDATSGVAGYDLEVSVDGGDWQRLLTNTQSTSYQYPGDYARGYVFRVTVRDNVGNEGEDEASVVVAAVTKYYYFGGQRVAMRGPDDAVTWLHGDHLGSTSLATDAAGDELSRQLYYPFGERRWPDTETLPTDFQFTGQRNDTSTGLYFFHARYYHSGLGRFVSADTIVPEPGDPQSLNRYSYVNNRPLAYVDPSGHMLELSPVTPIVDPIAGLMQAFSDAPPEWFLHYMPLYVQDNFPHLLEHAVEDWGLWNTGMVVKGTADMAYDAGAIDYDTLMEWYVGGMSIASSDPTHQHIVGMQASYGVELGMIGSALLPGFDAWWGYSPKYWPPETGRQLYRGLNPDNPVHAQQLATYNETGVVPPRGGNATITEHVNFNMTESPYTSWTLDPAEARRWAGPNGTILTVSEGDISNLRVSSYRWCDFPWEQEVSIMGPVPSSRVYQGP